MGFKPDGSNIPWVLARFMESDPERFEEWIGHIQTALPDLIGLRTVEREDDKHRYTCCSAIKVVLSRHPGLCRTAHCVYWP